ncbi:MAG: family 10 glycosylhydrolase [Pirellulales bacterium]|nr:family 10 glycosylhydrolase [Pirellulales bacterium]
MTLPSLMLLVAMGAAAHEKAIDAFDYAGAAAARQAWVASDGTPAPTVVEHSGRKMLEFEAPFAGKPDLPRTILDRDVKLDLSVPGEFTLDLAAENVEAVGSVNLYFRSGGGWYSAGAGLHKTGWQTLRFSKASFRTEQKPAGWHKIDGIRISVWRGQKKDSRVRLARLAAKYHDVALVIPAAGSRDDGESRAALDTAETVGSILSELGLGSDAVEDTAVARGALGDRLVAILAYNPEIGEEAVQGLVRFVEKGGKVLACYQLPAPLAKALGFDRAQYLKEKAGTFAQIRFDGEIPGMPQSVKQASWNITTAKPAGHNAQVVGWWFNEEGKPTNQPALLVSDRGAFFTHIILSDDYAAKKQMLAALLGKLASPLWEQMARSESEQVVRVGHLDSLGGLEQFVKSARNSAAAERLEAAAKAMEAAKAKYADRQYPQSIESARKAHELLVEAYLRSMPSSVKEGRAWWNHSGTGAYPGDWDRTCKELAAGGFNMILPNMLWGGLAHYPSEILPQSSTYQELGDQIEQCLKAAKKYGLEVHVWKVNHNLSNAPKDFIEKLRREGRTQVNVRGEPHDWICPSHPENQKLERESMLEVARKYDVDGLHFDYIRYPDRELCYCDGCRERFQANAGVKAANWPQDCYSGPLKDKYHDWRCEQITKLVASVYQEAKKIKPSIQISAAVFGSYPDCRISVGQDWVQWAKAGYVDFLCPMDYTDSDQRFINLVSEQLRLVEGKVPLYSGIGATSSSSTLPPDRVAGQAHHARALGAAGFTIFNLSQGTLEAIGPGFALGAGLQKAVPVHAKK